MNVSPAIIAASIAGGGIGLAGGTMVKGQKLEEQGASEFDQLVKPLGTGITTGLIGAGIGAGVSGTAVALKKVLGK